MESKIIEFTILFWIESETTGSIKSTRSRFSFSSLLSPAPPSSWTPTSSINPPTTARMSSKCAPVLSALSPSLRERSTSQSSQSRPWPISTEITDAKHFTMWQLCRRQCFLEPRLVFSPEFSFLMLSVEGWPCSFLCSFRCWECWWFWELEI